METKDTPSKGHSLFKQSSELEILISAAIVFAAFQIYDLAPQFIVNLVNNNVSNQSVFLFLAAIIALFLGALLPISILAHFILRFYWLALIGLKNSFETQQWEKLNYADKFTTYLKRRNNLDKHISKVDTICSSIFAFSFLAAAVFCFSSISIVIISRIFVYLVDDAFKNSFLQYILLVILLFFIIICLLGLIDFLTLGALKRIKKPWFIKFYYPINKFISIITFARFYRGLYYTFITNVPRYIPAIALPLYLIIAILILNMGVYESKLYAEDTTGNKMGEYAIMNSYYENTFNSRKIIQGPFIPSFIIKDNLLQLSYALTEQIDDALTASCDSVYSINSRGLHWRKWITMGINKRNIPKNFEFDKNAKNALSCFSNHLTITIDDSTYVNQRFYFKKLQTPEKITLTTFLDIEQLQRGNHVLKIQLLEPIGTSSYRIPFYKN